MYLCPCYFLYPNPIPHYVYALPDSALVCTALAVRTGGEWRVEIRPGKGLMAHIWTNGSQWSYLLIQPHYFTGINMSALTALCSPNPDASQQHANQKGGMRFPDFIALHLWHSCHNEGSLQAKLLTAISVNGSTCFCDPAKNLLFMHVQHISHV